MRPRQKRWRGRQWHESTGEALEAIGVLLTELAARETITREDRGRSDIFSHFLKENQVNCLVGLTAEETLSSILSIYKPNLPRSEQVVLCAETTTAETVKLLFRRASYKGFSPSCRSS